MKISDVIDFVDGIKPNAFTTEDKVKWLNELEGVIGADVLEEAEPYQHVWSSSWNGQGVKFPDAKSMVLPGRAELRTGGTAAITGLVTYSANNKSATVVSSSYDAGVTTVVFPTDTFSLTGDAGDVGTATVRYDGSGVHMIAPEMFAKIYYSYLEARIDAANGEVTKYANSMTLHNQFWGEFLRWYSRTNVDK